MHHQHYNVHMLYYPMFDWYYLNMMYSCVDIIYIYRYLVYCLQVQLLFTDSLKANKSSINIYFSTFNVVLIKRYV